MRPDFILFRNNIEPGLLLAPSCAHALPSAAARKNLSPEKLAEIGPFLASAPSEACYDLVNQAQERIWPASQVSGYSVLK
jgi:hypothetical protein